MNFRDLQYLVTVAQTSHFGRAADQCFVSQPTLSMQLKKLESELDVQLFERDKKQVRITREGELLVEQAKVVLREMQAMKDMAKLVGDPLAGDFRIGSIPTLGPYLFPYVTRQMRQELPRVNFYIYEEKTRTLVDKLKAGSLDAAVLALPIDEPHFHIEQVGVEAFVVALPNGHHLADREHVTVKDLEKEQVLLLEDGHCLRDQALSVCKHTDAQKHFNATSLETLRHMVSIGSGITLLPELSLSFQANADFSVVPFSSPAPTRHIGVMWRKSAVNTELCQKVSEIISASLGKALAEPATK